MDEILIISLVLLIPTVGLYFYFSDYKFLFYILAIPCLLLWVMFGLIVLGGVILDHKLGFMSFVTAVIAIAIPIFLSRHNPNGFSLLLAACYGAYFVPILFYLFATEFGRGMH